MARRMRRNRRFDEVNYMKREAMPLLWHAECAELYESQSDAKFASGRLLRFLRILREETASGRLLRFLRILREVLSYLTPIKSLREQFLVMFS